MLGVDFMMINIILPARHGKELECLDLVEGLLAFLEWLESLGGNIILVAHKCLDFDAKVLLRNLEEFEIPYCETIIGFSDSLLASRQLYPDIGSHKLSAMLWQVGLTVRESHDALEDAEDCRRICRRMAAQSGYKFLDFILNLSWFHDVDQQWDWTFPLGRILVGQLWCQYSSSDHYQDTSLSSGSRVFGSGGNSLHVDHVLV